jgi:hypothetical protein
MVVLMCKISNPRIDAIVGNQLHELLPACIDCIVVLRRLVRDHDKLGWPSRLSTGSSGCALPFWNVPFTVGMSALLLPAH